MQPPLPSQLCWPRPRPWHWQQDCPHRQLAWRLLLERHQLAWLRRRLLVEVVEDEALQAQAARSRPSSEAHHQPAMAAPAGWLAMLCSEVFLEVLLAEDEDFWLYLLCRRPQPRHRALLRVLAEAVELHLTVEEFCRVAPRRRLGWSTCLLV